MHHTRTYLETIAGHLDVPEDVIEGVLKGYINRKLEGLLVGVSYSYTPTHLKTIAGHGDVLECVPLGYLNRELVGS